MSLSEFKEIFWLEYIHRLLGRFIGIVFLLPFLYFLFAKKLNRPLCFKLAAIFFVGGLQGFVGWYMVKSGLVDNPAVSHYRLALHLFLAFFVFAMLFLTGLSLRKEWAGDNIIKAPTGLAPFSYLLTTLILLQIVLGAFVAGSRAGLVYNTFPLMDGNFFPPDLFFLKPWWLNFFENHAMIQFQHRITAYLLILMALVFRYKTYYFLKQTGNISTCRTVNYLIIALLCQAALGVATLLAQVPIWLASLHQVMAVVVFSFSLFINYRFHAINRAS